jgi:hypothetical protein
MKIGLSRTSNAARFIKCRVLSYDANSSQFKVVPYEQPDADGVEGILAKLLSPLPFDPKGGGIHSIPANPEGTGCWCVAIGPREYYIVGFFQYSSNQLNLNTQKNIELEPGETYIGHNTGTHMRFTKHGMFSVFTGIFSQFHVDPIAQTFLANFKNIAINTYGGWLKWIHKLADGTTYLKGEIHKRFDLSAIKVMLPTEKIKFHFGTIPTEKHIAQIETLQEPTSKTEYNTSTLLKYGKQSNTDKKIVQWSAEDKKEKIKYELNIDTNGKLIYSADRAQEKKNITMQLDVKNSGMVDIKISNDTKFVQLTIDDTGKTTVHVDPHDAKLYLGGTGKEQQIVTKAFLDQVYKSHIHGNGNQGAPTTSPMTPPIISLDLDSSTNHTTFTTKAE